jgi:hypothetical protein
VDIITGLLYHTSDLNSRLFSSTFQKSICEICGMETSPIKHRNGDDVLKKENNKKMRIKVCRRGKRKIEALCSSLRADPIGIFQFTAYGTNVFIDRSASGTQQTNNISALSIIH